MKRALFLPLVAVTLTAVVAGAPATASAAPGPKVRTASVKVVKADKRLADAKRTVAKSIAAKDTALARAADRVVLAELTIGEPDVLANIAADRTALAALRTTAATSTTLADVQTVAGQVAAVRPEVYDVVANGLRQAVRFQDEVAANATALADLGLAADAKAAEGYDVTAVRDLLASAEAANQEAGVLAAATIQKGLLLTAFTAAAKDAFTADLAGAGSALDTVAAQRQAVSDALALMVPAPEPVLEPVVEVVTDPVL